MQRRLEAGDLRPGQRLFRDGEPAAGDGALKCERASGLTLVDEGMDQPGTGQRRFDPVALPLLVLNSGLLPEARQRGRRTDESGPAAVPAELVQPAQEPPRER